MFDHPYKDYNFVPDGPWNTKNYLNNNYSRFYSLKKAMELIDDSYDMVLISRFDTVFYEKIDFSLLNAELSPLEYCEAFLAAHVALTMRFHSLVFALSAR